MACRAGGDQREGGQPPRDDEFDRESMRSLDDAQRILEDMLQEICNTLFVSEAAAFVTGDAADTTQAEVVREAVAKRIEVLDQGFLTACSAYASVLAASPGNADLLGLIQDIQQEVLRAVTTRMPAPMRVLDRVLGMADAASRRAFLEQCALADVEAAEAAGEERPDPPSSSKGPDSDSPVLPCATASIVAIANQFIADMEERETVPDRQLLARLCLAREDAWEVDRTLFERGAYEGRLMPAGGGDTGMPERAPSLVFPTELPRVQLGFLATLLRSPDQEIPGRVESAFVADQPDAVSPGVMEEMPQRDAEMAEMGRRLAAGQRGRGQGAAVAPPEVVRPGAFLLTLAALECEVVGSLPGAEVEQVERMRVIRKQAMEVLERMAAGELREAENGDMERDAFPI